MQINASIANKIIMSFFQNGKISTFKLDLISKTKKLEFYGILFTVAIELTCATECQKMSILYFTSKIETLITAIKCRKTARKKKRKMGKNARKKTKISVRTNRSADEINVHELYIARPYTDIVYQRDEYKHNALMYDEIAQKQFRMIYYRIECLRCLFSFHSFGSQFFFRKKKLCYFFLSISYKHIVCQV